MTELLALTVGFTGITFIFAYLAKSDNKISVSNAGADGSGRLKDFTPWKDFFIWITTMFASIDIFIFGRLARRAGASSMYGVLDASYLISIVIVALMSLFLFIKYFADVLSTIFGGEYGI